MKRREINCLIFQEWDLKKMSRDPSDKNKSAKAKVIYDERVFGGSGSGRGLMDASSAIMDSETEEEYFKRMHEFNNATAAGGVSSNRVSMRDCTVITEPRLKCIFNR